MLLVWFFAQITGTMVIQMIINAVGSLYTEVHGLQIERSQFAKSLAKNVFALRQSDKSVLCASVESKWIAAAGILKHDSVGKEHFKFTDEIFKAIDNSVFTESKHDAMEIAKNLGQKQEKLYSLKQIVRSIIEAQSKNETATEMMFSVRL